MNRMKRLPPYWLAGGSERCDLCTHAHVLEMQVRCVGCDRGVCDHCVVRVRETEEVFCFDCRPRGAEED